jgi:hypothetical protein
MSEASEAATLISKRHRQVQHIAKIESAGFLNLDFHGNLGHSIESNMEDRCFIEDGNTRRLGEIALFTFEPHIRFIEGKWGFKHENIYYFNPSGHLEEL